MRKSSPFVADADRFTVAALMVDRLEDWIRSRNVQRAAALPDEPKWHHGASSDGGIYSESAELFPGPRSAWVR